MSIKHLNYAFLIFIAFAAAGCTSVKPEHLAKAQSNQKIIITEKLTRVRGLTSRIEEGVLPGVYSAEREDVDGIYFFGEGRSFWTTNEHIQKIPRLHFGGIFLPKDKSSDPRFFYIFETDVHTTENLDAYIQNKVVTSTAMPAPGISTSANIVGTVIAGSIVNAMIQSGVGKIKLVQEIKDKDLKEKIYAGLTPQQSEKDKE